MDENENNKENEELEDDDKLTEQETIYTEMSALKYDNYSIDNIRQNDRGAIVADLYIEADDIMGKALVGKEIQVGYIGLFVNAHFSIVALESLMEEVVTYSVTRNEEKLDGHLKYIQDEFNDVVSVISHFTNFVISFINLKSIMGINNNTD